jgi:predicted GIY-YIG superfamily endonuclease
MNAQVYRCFNKEGDLLYVGCSSNVAARLADHKRISVWYEVLARVEISDPMPRERALEAEKRAIIQEGPRFNAVRGNDLTKTPWNWKSKGLTGYQIPNDDDVIEANSED